MSGGMFDAKLRELDRNYEAFRRRILLLQRGDAAGLQQEIEKSREEQNRLDEALRSMAVSGRSPAVSSLAKAQLDYCEKAERAISNLYSGTGRDLKTPLERTEAAILFAEYAMDFAASAAHYAVLAAMLAADMQYKEGDKS